MSAEQSFWSVVLTMLILSACMQPSSSASRSASKERAPLDATSDEADDYPEESEPELPAPPPDVCAAASLAGQALPGRCTTLAPEERDASESDGPALPSGEQLEGADEEEQPQESEDADEAQEESADRDEDSNEDADEDADEDQEESAHEEDGERLV